MGSEMCIRDRYERAARERKVNQTNDNDKEEDLLSLGPMVVGGPLLEAGTGSAGGSVTLTSWRAPSGR